MNKDILKIFVIIFLLVFTAISIPVIAESNNIDPVGITKITAIGSFARCDQDDIVYGHIFIGFKDNKPVFNEDIEISASGIGLIIMTNHFLHCSII
jgi:hypothetical protein